MLARELVVGGASGNGRVRWRRGGGQEKDKAEARVTEIIRAQVPWEAESQHRMKLSSPASRGRN